MDFLKSMAAVLAANALTIIVVYLIWAARHGHSAPLAMKAGSGLIFVGGRVLEFYIAILIIFGVASLLSWLL